MASCTSATIDDQQERHYIGNLLFDDDPFSPPNNKPTTAQQLPVGNVLSGGGPIGPSPNPAFWPEPPPPYSPYSVRPMQWCTINRQTGDLYNSQLNNSYSHLSTFYSPVVYNRPRGWDGFGNASVEGYPLLGSGLPYGSHPPFAPHMSGRYVVPQETYQHRNGCFSGIYSSFNSNESIQMERASRLPSEEFYRNENVTMHPKSMDGMSPVAPSLLNGNGCLPLGGKSYRDAASEKKRSKPVSSASEFMTMSMQDTDNKFVSSDAKVSKCDSQDLSCLKSLKASANNGNNGIKSVLTGSKIVENAVGKQSSTLNTIKKGKSRNFYNQSDNEFQKITRKKTKGTKNTASGEEGQNIVNQPVDASSRFDILQSLNNQISNNVPRSLSVSPSEVPKSHGASKIAKAERVSTNHSVKTSSSRPKKQKDTTSNIESTVRLHDSVALSTAVSGLLQRAALKKTVFGLRRDSGERNLFETPRFASRKQRGGIRKRSTGTLDYLVCFFFAAFLFFKGAVKWIADLIIDISFQSRDVAVYVLKRSYLTFMYCCHQLRFLILSHMKYFWANVRNVKKYFSSQFLERRSSEEVSWGLDENINLPSTGDDALNRLLRCKGKDAYAILGLRADCSDEEIKHYYKKQAFLVHPDKNVTEGSAEAFRLLSKAFEIISTSELRISYNVLRLSSPVHKELEELWQNLCDKVDEIKNSLPCDCGKRHCRIAMKNISPQQARFCKRCNTRHPAKHNDIWAESSFLGLWWTYYACLDGVVYNVSEWANCPKNNLKNLKADTHGIQYCMVSYACGTSTRRDVSLKRARKGQMQRYCLDECDVAEDYRYGMDDDFTYAASHGFGDMGDGAQLTHCRSLDRRLFNHDRLRRTERKKKFH